MMMETLLIMMGKEHFINYYRCSSICEVELGYFCFRGSDPISHLKDECN